MSATVSKATGMQPNESLDALANEHRGWLTLFDSRYLQKWENIYRHQYEAAMTEAGVRRLLASHEIKVAPNEDVCGNSQRPDFACTVPRRSGLGDYHFYVEVTSISIEKATRVTGVADVPSGASGYRLLNDAIFHACKGKAEQCANADAPTLLAIGTFHWFAATVCFDKTKVNMLLTGEAQIAWDLNIQTGRAVGEPYQTTDLRSATFLKPDATQEVGYALSSISGLLLCGFRPQSAIGLLHPNPARPFERSALAGIGFGEVIIDGNSSWLRVRWI